MFTEVIKLKENKLADLSIDFAVNIIKLCETIKGDYSLVNQLEHYATGFVIDKCRCFSMK